MISLIGITSLPVLLLSIVFVFFHSKFIRLYNAYRNSRDLLNELLMHKQELLMFFSFEMTGSQVVVGDDVEVLQSILKLEDELSNFSFTDEDRAELDDLEKEIKGAQNMYNQAREKFSGFTSKFPGKHFATFLADKSMK